MQSTQDPRRDHFDMAKLQKSLKQQQHRSTRLRGVVTKLTPAEIRSMNNSVAASKGINGSSPARRHRSGTTTPPLTPGDTSLPQHPAPGRNSVNLPTPPRSPDDALPRRQNSSSGNGMHIHSPTPRSNSKAGFVLAANNSRPQSASSHRGMPTYRGPELTKTGSVSMLHSVVMTNQIVDNPLSQFSRPRQSRGSVSPTRQDWRRYSQIDQDDAQSFRSQSLPVATASPSDRSKTPPRLTESPVSSADKEPHDIQFVEPHQPVEAVIDKTQTIANEGPIPSEPHSRFSWGWRKSLTAHRNENSKTSEPKSNHKTLFLNRSSKKDLPIIAQEITTPENRLEMTNRPSEEVPLSETSIDKEMDEKPPLITREFDPHPAVRPLTTQPQPIFDPKGKGKAKARETPEVVSNRHDILEDDAMQMFSRCACCGKLRKIDCNRSLSPVLENENLRTNFSMEIERTDDLAARRKRSSSASRQKYTPIIPMMALDSTASPEKIALKAPEIILDVSNDPIVVINERGDIIASGSEPIALIPKQLEDKGKKMVRFSSLHFKAGTQIQTNMGQKVTDRLSKKPEMGTIIEAPAAQSDQEIIATTSRTDEPYFPDTRNFSEILPTFLGDSNSSIRASEEITSELMEAINNIGTSVNGSYLRLKKHVDTQALDTTGTTTPVLPIEFSEESEVSSVRNEALSPQNEQQSEQTEPLLGVALTTDDVVIPDSSLQSVDEPSTITRTVSFGPPSVEQSRTSTPTSNPSTRKSALKRRPVAPQAPASNYAEFYSDPSRGITTKPKATAQFLFRNNSDYSPANSGSSQTTPQSSSQRNSVVLPSARPNSQFEARIVDSSRPRSYIEHRSQGFEPSPLTQIRKNSQGSSTSLDKFVFPKTTKSNLVESVLAATGGRRGSSNSVQSKK